MTALSLRRLVVFVLVAVFIFSLDLLPPPVNSLTGLYGQGDGHAYAAQKKVRKKTKHSKRRIHEYFPPPVSSSIVVDADTGEVLFELKSDARVRPASLTKMMTLYLTFERLKQGSLRLEDRIRVSRHATYQSPMKLDLINGATITVQNAILGVVTKSANDAAVVLGEAMAGSEKAFAKQMTAKAKALGMKNTVFQNASGLPDRGQYSTARDMGILGLSLIRDFPQYYAFFGVRTFNFGGVANANHNKLLGEVKGVDGIKTGYIRSSGFNLVASAQRNGKRVVVVVMGGGSVVSRDNRVTKLIEAAYETLGAAGSYNPEKKALMAAANEPEIVPLQEPSAEGEAADQADDETAQTAIKALTIDNGVAGGFTNDLAPGAGGTSGDGASGGTGGTEGTGVIPKSTVGANTAESVQNPPDQSKNIATNNTANNAAAAANKPAESKLSGILAMIKSDLSPLLDTVTLPATQPNSNVVINKLNRPLITDEPIDELGGKNRKKLYWSVQVGAFGTATSAQNALVMANEMAKDYLEEGKATILPKSGKMPYRARIVGLIPNNAKAACRSLVKQGMECKVIRSASGT